MSVTVPYETGRDTTPASAPAAPAASYGELLRETRTLRWSVRAAVAVPAGVLFWVLFTWWLGLAVMLVVAVLDTVYRVKTHSTIPVWRKAGSSERQTERQLYRIEAKGYRALHARAIPGTDAQIDHLVVGPTGVFAVDSEKWDRHLPVRAYPNRLFVGPFSRNERIEEAKTEADRARDLLSEELGFTVEVVPALAIYGPTIPWKILQVRGVDVLTGGRVRKWIRRRQPTFSASDVERIVQAARVVLPLRAEVEAPN